MIRFAASLAALLAISTGPAHAHGIAPVPSTHKLTATSPGVPRAFPVRPVQLRAARGEWECFQVVVRADQRAIKSLKLQATTLATQLGQFIGRDNVQVFREHFTFVPKPSGNAELQPLWWSDALVPLGPDSTSACEARKAIAFWVAVRAPQDAQAGEYYGALDFDLDGEARTLAVTLNVEDVAMPAPTMRGTVAVYYDILRDWYKKSGRPFSDADWAAQKRLYYDFLLGYRVNAYDLPVAWDDPLAAKYLSDSRVTSVRLPPLGTPEMPLALKALEAARAKKKAFYYHIDEPTPESYPQVLAATRQLRALDPSLKHLVTIHPNAALKDAVDIWCPNIGDATGVGWIDFERLEAERKAGRETWWYTMVEPKYPYPTWLLDDDALAVRSYGWMMARWGISGFVYSMAHGWGPDPFANLQSFADTWGDGTLLYPGELVGETGPIPSIRLMLLRDAIEDYELLKRDPKAVAALDQPMPGEARRRLIHLGHAANLKAEFVRGVLFGPEAAKKPGPSAVTREPDGFVPEISPDHAPTVRAPTIDGVLSDAAWRGTARVETRGGLFKRFVTDSVAWPATSLFVALDSKYLYAALRARSGPRVRDDLWLALEAAPRHGGEKWRFVITAKGTLVVERHAREGRFRVENVEWKAAMKKSSGHTDVEMRIPLSLLADKAWGINALRRVTTPSGTRVTLRAYDDASHAGAMPLFGVR